MSAFLTLVLLPLLSSAPLDAQDTVRYGRVSADSTTLHSNYDAKTASLGELKKGLPVRVVGDMEPWVRVEVPGGLDLWIHGDYVEFDGATGHATNDRVRARPLPSTESRSHPIGYYRAAEELLRLDADGDWVKVRAPERLGAWLRADSVKISSVKPEGWDADWADWAKRRAPKPVAGESEAELEEVPTVEPAPVEIGEIEAAGPVIAEYAQATNAAAAKQPKAEDLLPTPAEIAGEPAVAMDEIEEQLNIVYKAMVGDREYWDRSMLDALEISIGHLLWNAEDDALLDRGRQAQRRIDVLRRSYLDALGRQVRAAEKRGDDEVAILLRHRLNLASAPVATEGEVLVMGIVEYEAAPHAGRPFRIERLGYSADVHSFDGRYSLRDYRGREVVLLGTWRDEKVAAGEEPRRVFDVRQLRVLPKLKVKS